KGRHLASAARRRHLQRGVQLRCRTIFGAHREHPPELVGGVRRTIPLREDDGYRCNGEQPGQAKTNKPHCHKSLRIISYRRKIDLPVAVVELERSALRSRT